MSLEIERKFLVNTEKLKNELEGTFLSQAYLTEDPARTVRVRIAGDQAFLTIKGPTNGITRKEFEYSIPVEDARDMMHLSIFPPVEKTRYKITFEGNLWELDIFHGKNEGLIMAEVELLSENQEIILPVWIGKEVSGDHRYFNSYLAKCPFRSWDENKTV